MTHAGTRTAAEGRLDSPVDEVADAGSRRPTPTPSAPAQREPIASSPGRNRAPAGGLPSAHAAVDLGVLRVSWLYATGGRRRQNRPGSALSVSRAEQVLSLLPRSRTARWTSAVSGRGRGGSIAPHQVRRCVRRARRCPRSVGVLCPAGGGARPVSSLANDRVSWGFPGAVVCRFSLMTSDASRGVKFTARCVPAETSRPAVDITRTLRQKSRAGRRRSPENLRVRGAGGSAFSPSEPRLL